MKTLCQYHLDLLSAAIDTPIDLRHPDVIFGELVTASGVEILECHPFPIGDCWIFTVDDEIPETMLPHFIRRINALRPEDGRQQLGHKKG